MKCIHCPYEDCSLRSSLGGCVWDGSQEKIHLRPPRKSDSIQASWAHGVNVNPGYICLAKKVKEMREYQELHKKTLVYGWRSKAQRLEREVDETIKSLGI